MPPSSAKRHRPRLRRSARRFAAAGTTRGRAGRRLSARAGRGGPPCPRPRHPGQGRKADDPGSPQAQERARRRTPATPA